MRKWGRRTGENRLNLFNLSKFVTFALSFISDGYVAVKCLIICRFFPLNVSRFSSWPLKLLRLFFGIYSIVLYKYFVLRILNDIQWTWAIRKDDLSWIKSVGDKMLAHYTSRSSLARYLILCDSLTHTRTRSLSFSISYLLNLMKTHRKMCNEIVSIFLFIQPKHLLFNASFKHCTFSSNCFRMTHEIFVSFFGRILDQMKMSNSSSHFLLHQFFLSLHFKNMLIHVLNCFSFHFFLLNLFCLVVKIESYFEELNFIVFVFFLFYPFFLFQWEERREENNNLSSILKFNYMT